MLNTLLNKPFAGFEKKSIDFLKSLSNPKFNNKTWFDNHREEYDLFLKVPMRNLIDELAVELKKIDSDIVVNNKSIFRINRDVRFSKDKTPYKSHLSAAFTFERNKTPEVPLFYFHFSKDEFLFAAGQYSTDNIFANKIRRSIADNYETFREIILNTKFRQKYGQVQGISLVKYPKGFENFKNSRDTLLTGLIRKKQFYVFRNFNLNNVLKPKMKDLIVEGVSDTLEFTKFLYNAIK